MDSYVKKRKRVEGDVQGLSRSEPSISNGGTTTKVVVVEGRRSPLTPEETRNKRQKQDAIIGEKEVVIEYDTTTSPPTSDNDNIIDLSDLDQLRKLREFQIKSLAIEPKEIKLGRRLGGGQNGVVYEGECRSKKVAVKVCKNMVGKKWDDFLEEIQIMA